jgi:hypothetical protein
MSTTIKKLSHSSKNSSDSTNSFPLPSLCSSISSTKTTRKRWDDSQFAIELCDDNLVTIDISNTSTSNSLKQKIINSSNKLFHLHTNNTTPLIITHRHSSHSTNSSTSSTTSQSSKLSSISRKLKNIISL